LDAIKTLNAVALAEVGYLEKKSNASLDSKRDNAGLNNYTKYARDLYPSLQGQPWCDMFVDWCFTKAFGKIKAKMLLGGFSAYTPDSADFFKVKGRYFSKPNAGDVIFFKNERRIYHTGIVTSVSGSKVFTIEGNTSNGTEVVPNGGAVCEKWYMLDNPKIAGYGRPDWSIVEQKDVYKVGWNKDDNGWWYANTPSTYFKEGWQVINHHKYYFNQDGYALTDWHIIDGKYYYFEPRKGHELECALYVSDKDGVQRIGEF
jgi:hypothetical protein